MKRVMRRTIRGWKRDRVHVVADVDPLDVPLGGKPMRYVYVTSRDTMLAEYACAMLTPAPVIELPYLDGLQHVEWPR